MDKNESGEVEEGLKKKGGRFSLRPLRVSVGEVDSY